MEYIKAKKKYGQNFLKNEEVLIKIVSSVEVGEKDLLLEIGPGMGALTSYLFNKHSYLVCYEIDERMRPYLEKFETEKSKIIYDDFLKRNVLEDLKEIPFVNMYVIANIPYNITSPIITKLIEMENKPKEIVLLVQKEFAERIAASSGHKEYNAFTLFVAMEYNAELLFFVDREYFFPVPNVDSAVVKLTRKEKKGILNKENYLKFIQDAFRNKRKTLKNNLKEYDWEQIKQILEELGYKETVRAEEITKDDFENLVNMYERRIS